MAKPEEFITWRNKWGPFGYTVDIFHLKSHFVYNDFKFSSYNQNQLQIKFRKAELEAMQIHN